MVLTALVAAINLTVFIALRGRWDRRLPLLLLASLLGTATGNAIGARTGLELVRIGDFHLLAASLGAQVAMLATDLLAQLGPIRPAPERPTRSARDGDRLDR
ncbi:MAG: hypothetical protein ACXWMN_01865 [Candidatus Limnocylindria bacterium]